MIYTYIDGKLYRTIPFDEFITMYRLHNNYLSQFDLDNLRKKSAEITNKNLKIDQDIIKRLFP